MLRRTAPFLLGLLVCLLAAQLSQADSTLRIDESRVRLLLREAQGRVSLELDNGTGRAFDARASVEFLDPRDRVRAAAEMNVEVRRGVNRLELPFSSLPGTDEREFPWYRLRYRVAPLSGAASPVAGVVSISEAAPDIFELSVVAPDEARGGSTLRARVRAWNPITRLPARGVAVGAALTVEVNDEETVLRAAASTDADGLASVDFALPRGVDGEGDLKVTARRGAFGQEASTSVSFEEGPRVMLTTDKSLYQPGQTMHMRALVLDPSEHAAADETVSFKVEDEEGSTVFNAEQKTSRFGVASADWPVPEGARLGRYTVKLEPDGDKYSEDYETRATVRVGRYELPNFSVSARPDRPFYLAGQDAEVEVAGDYLFGQPVKRGRVRVVRETERNWNWREQKYVVKEGEAVEGALDDRGRFVARLPLSAEHRELADSSWRRFNDLNFTAYVNDPTTGRTEQRRFSLRLTKEPIHLYVSEGRYRQAPGLPLAFYLSTFYADGSPAQCEVSLTQVGAVTAYVLGPDGQMREAREPDRTLLKVRTNRYGVAKVTGPALTREGGRRNLSLRFEARDRDGRTGRHAEDFWLTDYQEESAPAIRVETDRTLYRAGEPVAVRLASSKPGLHVLVDAVSDGRPLFSRAVKLTDGRASLSIPYAEEFRNGVTITATSLEPPGDDDYDYSYADRTVVYPSGRELKLEARLSRASYQPGDEAEVTFDVRSPDGRRAESALGVVVFDKAVEERARTDAEASRGFGFYGDFYGFWYGGGGDIAGVTRRDIERLDLSRPAPDGLDAVAELIYNGQRTYYDRRSFGGTSFEREGQRVFKSLVGAQLLPLKAALERNYQAAGSYPRDEAALAGVLSASGIEPGALSDPWGQPYRARFRTARDLDLLEIYSHGPDERAGTEDDFTAELFSWPYFRPVGLRIDAAAAEYHARTGGFVRDLPTLSAELRRRGFDLDSLRDPWGQPYAFDFDVQGTSYRIRARSAGPDKTFAPASAHGSDDLDLWTNATDYFAEGRAAVEKALAETGRATAALPQTEAALAALLSKAGVNLKELRDGWGRPAYAAFRKNLRHSSRVTVETRAQFNQPGRQQQATVRPAVETVYFVSLRSAGEDGRPGTADDFDLGTFTSVADEKAEDARRASRPAVTFSGATGAISGNVLDPNGAAIAGAVVTVRHRLAEVEFETKTKEDGTYLLRGLPSGLYRLTVSAAGFIQYVLEDVQVQASNLTHADATLSVGGVSETVTVTSDAAATVNLSMSSSQTAPDGPPGTRPPLSTPRLREFFPETLVWQPSVETDREGRAALRFKLADNITTWKMSVVASTEDGRVGLFEKEFLSFQPFFAEHDPPRVLTEGDEISLPVVVRNYLDRAQAVQVEMKPEGWFALKGQARQQAEVAAGEAARPTFDFRATSSVAEGRQRVTAYGADASDAVEKPVTVHPDGEERADTAGAVFGASTALDVRLPADTVPGSVRSELKVYPNLTAHILEGVEGIMQRPYGCGEQTVSSTYPSVYVLNYYRQLGQDIEGDLPPVGRLARRYARLGYERLLGYRAPGGGFTYWGRGDADFALSAYALRFLVDASEVIDVDERVVNETRDWLATRQREDGSWPANGWGNRDDKRRAALNTAFVARVFAALHRKNAAAKKDAAASPAASPMTAGAVALTRALRYLAARMQETNEPYLIASYALAAFDAGDHEGARKAASRLRALAHEEGGAAYWPLDTNTPFYGWGRAGVIETTALVVQALTRADSEPGSGLTVDDALVGRGLLYLLRNKDRHGVWLSTQATVNVIDALLALVAADAAARHGSYGQTAGDVAEVYVNGRRAGELALPPPSQLAAPVRLDLSAFVSAGTSRVEVRRRGTPSQAQAQLVTTYYVPWQRTAAPETEARKGAGSLRLAVSYDHTAAEAGQEVTCSVEAARTETNGYGMLLAEVGLPPGADVDRASLERAVKEGGYAVNSYDVQPDRLVFYLWPSTGGTRFSFKFRPRYGLNALTAPSQIYDYYNPDARTVLPPTRFVVR